MIIYDYHLLLLIFAILHCFPPASSCFTIYSTIYFTIYFANRVFLVIARFPLRQSMPRSWPKSSTLWLAHIASVAT